MDFKWVFVYLVTQSTQKLDRSPTANSHKAHFFCEEKSAEAFVMAILEFQLLTMNANLKNLFSIGERVQILRRVENRMFS